MVEPMSTVLEGREPRLRPVEGPRSPADRTRWAFRGMAVALGGMHAWIASLQQSMNPDGIAYLEMGEAYFRGDWAMAVNTTWSPLYAWIQGGAATLLRPEPAWEFTLVHAVNFLIFLFAFGCFEFFWFALGPGRTSREQAPDAARWPDWAWAALGSTLFLWCAITLIEPWAVTPDMLMMGFVLLAAGLLVRIAGGDRAPGRFLALGLVLGLGYLAKAVMFPLAFVFLGATLLATGRPRSPSLVAIALLGFALLAGPYVALLSLAKERPTFGDGGRLTFIRYANGVVYPHWREGYGAAAGTPIHPSRRIFEEPAAFEFAQPVGGSYPISYDPSHWYEGVSPRIEPRMQLARLIESLRFYADLFAGPLGAPAAVVLLLLALGRRGWREAPGALLLVGISAAALTMYGLVYVEGRYVAAFLLLLWGGLLALVRLPSAAWAERLLAASATVVLAFVFVSLTSFHLDCFVRVAGLHPPSDVATRAEAPYYRPVRMAAELSRMGLRPGDEIAYVGTAFDAFFARLARLRIVAEVPDTDIEAFWGVDRETRARLLGALRATGARAVVVEHTPPPGALLDGWERIGDSRHHLFWLR
jgi:hypothetical protein